MPGEFDAFVIRQASCCLICERRTAILCVDHDHVTGEVRGVLCRTCNVQLGIIEKPGWLGRALEYIACR